MKINDWKLLLISIFICQLAGIIGSIFTISSVTTWYLTLNKPLFNPPNWIFGPVWTILYTLMGISLYLIWKQGWKDKKVKFALMVFFIHLSLNSFWSILFFGLKILGLAFAEILLLWLLISYLIFLFAKINKLAGYLLIPYLVWVTFASILNFSVWTLN